MRFPSSIRSRACAACALFVFALPAIAQPAAAQTAADKSKEVKVSDGESKLAEKLNKAPDVASKLQAAEELIKKYPKSQLRPQAAVYLSEQIKAVADAAQKTALSERYLALFDGAGEGDVLAADLFDSYVAAKRFDDAFGFGQKWLARSPNDLHVLATLAFHGVDQARANNPKFVEQGRQYGVKAIELMEAGTKPATFNEAQFSQFKSSWLPKLYQAQGLLALVSGNLPDALTAVRKAVELNQSDPAGYLLLASVRDEEYQKMAVQYKGMAAGAARNEMLTKINAQLDEVIDLYAHAVGLTEGEAQYQQMRGQVLEILQSYYKYRHNGSTDGMQQLIDKYKKPATP